MSNSKTLAKEIGALEREMKELESKRTRSLSALVDALIEKRDVDPVEVRYFRQYTDQIDEKRTELIQRTEELQRQL